MVKRAINNIGKRKKLFEEFIQEINLSKEIKIIQINFFLGGRVIKVTHIYI